MMEVAANVIQPIQGTVADGLLVNLGTNNDIGINAGTNNIGDVDIVSGTVTTVSTVTNLSQQGGVAISLNTGVRDTGTQRVTIATNDVVPVSQSGTWDEVGINDSGNNISVDWAGTAPPIGAGVEATALRVTVATDSTGVLSVDDNGGVLTVDGTVTAAQATAANLNCTEASASAIKTAVQLIDDMISGTEAQVDIVAALPAGTNAIGKLAANSGVDIGDVDVTSLSHGKTILSAGGQASSSGNNTLVAAGTNKLKVFAFSLSTVSTTAVTCIFQTGAGGATLWRVVLQTPASVAGGANLAVSPPAWLFATASATLLNLNLSAAVAVEWSVSYVDEA